MKKRLLVTLLALVAALCCAFGLAACGIIGGNDMPTHTHGFINKIAEEKYLKTAATCTDKAVYYYSCDCGEIGTETFEYGEVKAHTFDKQVAEEKYLKSEATCTHKAVYYVSCSVCGEKGTETFEQGEILQPTEGLKYTLNFSTNTYEVTGIDSNAGNVVIATTYESLPVNAIGAQAFQNKENIKTVFIPDGVTSIGWDAFSGCSELASITYNGTMEQWNAIVKESYYDHDTGNVTIHCSDGDLDKGGNEITA